MGYTAKEAAHILYSQPQDKEIPGISRFAQLKNNGTHLYFYPMLFVLGN